MQMKKGKMGMISPVKLVRRIFQLITGMMSLSILIALPLSSAMAVTIGGFNSDRGGPQGSINKFEAIFGTSFPDATIVATPTLTPEFLAGIDVLILSAVTGRTTPLSPLSGAEQAALEDFVQNGGGAYLVSDNSSFQGASNSFLQPFGIVAGGSDCSLVFASIVDRVTFPEITDGPFGIVETLRGGCIGSFSNTGFSTVLASWSAGSLAGSPAVLAESAIGLGEGRIVAVGDNELASFEDGRTLLFNAICFLSKSSNTCPRVATFLLLDADAIDTDTPAIEALADMMGVDPASLVNDAIADKGVRAVLPIPVGTVLALPTGQVGDEGWFALKETSIPASWDAAGPTADGLQNYLVPGPGLGLGNDPEALLDMIQDVTPLRTAGLDLLPDTTVCALVYKSDISINYGPLEGNLQGANRGLIAFDVIAIGPPSGSSFLPEMTVEIVDAAESCEEELTLLEDAPAPISSSEPSE